MQIRFLSAAILIHGSLIVGLVYGVQSGLENSQQPARLHILPVQERWEMQQIQVAELPRDFQLQPHAAPMPDPLVEEMPAEAEPVEEDPEATLPPAPESKDMPAQVWLMPLPKTQPAQPQPAEPQPPQPMVQAEPLQEQNRAPDYPPRALRLGMEGEVILLVQVDRMGRAQQVQLLQSCGSTAPQREMDRAAIQAVQAWKFRPATLAGEPVDTQLRLRVLYRIQGTRVQILAGL